MIAIHNYRNKAPLGETLITLRMKADKHDTEEQEGKDTPAGLLLLLLLTLFLFSFPRLPPSLTSFIFYNHSLG